MSFAAYKSKTVVRSVMGAETYSFVDLFDSCYTLRDELQTILGQSLPMAMLTDSGCLFDVIVKSSRTSEKRLTININSAKEAYDHFQIDDIGWIPGATNTADSFTKLNSKNVLEEFMDTGGIKQNILQWIIGQGRQTCTGSMHTTESSNDNKGLICGQILMKKWFLIHITSSKRSRTNAT